jgi:hypothetical protein
LHRCEKAIERKFVNGRFSLLSRLVGGNFFDNALPSGSGSLKQSILVADTSANKDFTFLIHDPGIHLTGVEIDATDVF